MFVLVLVFKDSLRIYLKSLSWSLGVRSLSWSLGGQVLVNIPAHYLDINNLLPIYQSGFHKGHSAETLLVRLLPDIYGAIDKSEVTP